MATVDIAMRRPHSVKQESMITFPGNVAALCGRRFGKTDGYVQRIFYWLTKRPGLYWWVGLSWKSASMKRAWREVSAVARVVLRSMGLSGRGYINKSNHDIIIPGLGEIWFRTAENEQSLAGEGTMGVVLDEFTLMAETVWTEYIQATLIDYGGWAAFGGVPKGNNWGSALWRSAAEKADWLQVHATSYENGVLDPAMIDAIKNDVNTPEFFFRQEYMAEILTAEGMVFRRINEAAVLEPLDEPAAGRPYMAGVDVADAQDFTVISVMDAERREQVYLDRFNRVGYTALEDRLEAVYKRFGLQVMVIESNSIGQPVIDHLRGRDMNIIPFYTSYASKQPLIQGLQSAFEHGTIKVINDPVQVGELQAYESERTAAGFRYGAPAGLHDDTVMALALNWLAISQGSAEITNNPFYG